MKPYLKHISEESIEQNNLEGNDQNACMCLECMLAHEVSIRRIENKWETAGYKNVFVPPLGM